MPETFEFVTRHTIIKTPKGSVHVYQGDYVANDGSNLRQVIAGSDEANSITKAIIEDRALTDRKPKRPNLMQHTVEKELEAKAKAESAPKEKKPKTKSKAKPSAKKAEEKPDAST